MQLADIEAEFPPGGLTAPTICPTSRARSKDGLVHVSQLAKGRVNKPSDVVSDGQKVKVKLMGFDDRGKVRLSMRVVDQETGADIEGKDEAAA